MHGVSNESKGWFVGVDGIVNLEWFAPSTLLNMKLGRPKLDSGLTSVERCHVRVRS